MRVSALIALSLAAALSTVSLDARAQDDRVAYADRLFSHGVELMKNDDCRAAVPEFVESQRLDPSAATLANLATCHARLGRRATAWKTYREAAALAAAEGNQTLRGQALSAMSRLSPTLTKLRIVPPSDTQALSLRLNGEPLEAYDGVPIPLDSGESVIEAFAPGREPWRRTVNANEVGATLVIEVPELRPAEKPRDHVDLRPHAVIVGGVGVAMIVVGTVLGLSAKRSDDQASLFCRAGRCTSEGVSLREEAGSKATAATYVTGLGLVATGTGVALWFAAKPPEEQLPNEGVLTERFHSGDVGISWSGQF
jgi:hypothetical protein